MTKNCEKFEVLSFSDSLLKPLSSHKDSKTKNHKYSVFRDEPAFPKVDVQSSICQLTDHKCDDGPTAELETGRLPIFHNFTAPRCFLCVHNQPDRKAHIAYMKSSSVNHSLYNRHDELVTGAAETSSLQNLSVSVTIRHVGK